MAGYTKTELRDIVKRRLGAPMVKVELCDQQINDNIDYARNKYIKWAIGNTTQEIYFTLMLEAGQNLYNLPAGIVEVIDYNDRGSMFGGINQLFTMQNYMFYNMDMRSSISGGFGMVDYHLALNFFETLQRYNHSKYNWRYHRHTNQLEITPTPAMSSGNLGTQRTVIRPDPITGIMTSYVIDSPGIVLVRAYMVSGASLPDFRYSWDDILTEKKTIIENRVVTADEILRKYLVLRHTPVETTGIKMSITGSGVEQIVGVDYKVHTVNTRVLYWDGLALDGVIQAGDSLVITYPVAVDSQYYPSEWTTNEHLYEIETRTLSVQEYDNGYIMLQSLPVKINLYDVDNNIIGQNYQISLNVGGVDAGAISQETNTDWNVDPLNPRRLYWIPNSPLANSIQVGSNIVVEYTALKINAEVIPSLTSSYVRTYETRVENRVLTSTEVILKKMVLASQIIAPDGMSLSINGIDLFYGIDYFLDSNDNKTVVFQPHISNLIIAGNPVIAVYTTPNFVDQEVPDPFFDSDWIIDYVTALSKINLGIIRRKMSGFTGLGNSGIEMDGADMVSDGKEEKEYLEQTLRDEEPWEGSPIIMG